MANKAIDPVWDYNCPQYVDFSETIKLDDNADKWFDQINEDASSKVGTPKAKKTPKSKGTPKIKLDKVAAENSPSSNMKSSNLYSSLSQWHSKKGISSEKENTNKAPQEKSSLKRQHISMSNVTANETTSRVTRSLKRSNSVRVEKQVEEVGHRQKKILKRNNSVRADLAQSSSSNVETSTTTTLKRSNSVRSAVGRLSGSLGSLKRSSSNSSMGASRVLRSRTLSKTDDSKSDVVKGDESRSTRAKVPRMFTSVLTSLKKVVSGVKGKSSEEMQMEAIARMKKDLVKRRQQAQVSLKKSKMAVTHPVALNPREPTTVMTFKFCTDDRVKQQETSEENCMIDFTRSLRSNTATSQAPLGLTIVQPFKFSGRNTTPQPSEKFQSMAQSVAAFHSTTPDRYRRKLKATDSDKKIAPSKPPQLTHPQTPKLEARYRHRTPHVISQQEIDDKEFEECQKHQFKAHPVNTKILQHTTGLHKPDPKPTTEIESFSLHMDQRLKGRSSNLPDEEAFVFTAQPVPTKLLQQVQGVKPAKRIPATVPHSPAFTLQNRVRLPIEIPLVKEENRSTLKINTSLHTGIPFQPKLSHKTTTIAPFSFEERHSRTLENKEAKIKQQIEEEQKAREFRANPLRNFDPVLPERQTKEATKLEPFKMLSDIRGERRNDELHQKVEEELAQQKKATEFRAQSARVLYSDPFMPEKSTRPLTDMSKAVLNTERRAADRDDFEMRKKARESQLAEILHEREQRKVEEEKVAIAKLRSELVHKPHGVRKFAPVLLQPSEKSPTQPESPRFSNRFKR